MTTTTDVSQLVIHKLTKQQYEGLTPNPNELYMVTDEEISYNDLIDKPTIPTTTDSVTSGSSAALTSGGAYTALSGKQDTSTAVTHTASTAVGSATNPVYIASNGVATATTYSLAKSVPSDAVFTDTTYSAFSGAQASAAGTSGLVPAPASGETSKYLKSDGTWATVNTSPTFTYDSTTETLTIS